MIECYTLDPLILTNYLIGIQGPEMVFCLYFETEVLTISGDLLFLQIYGMFTMQIYKRELSGYALPLDRQSTKFTRFEPPNSCGSSQ